MNKSTGPRGQGRGVGTRTLQSAANEGIKSLWTLLFAVWLAREVAAVEFAAYAITFAILHIAIGLSQGVASLPMIVKFGASERRMSRDLAGTVLGVTLVASLAPIAVYVVLWALWQGGPLATCSLAFALIAPVVLLHHCCANIFYARQQQLRALAANALWMVAGAVLLALLPTVYKGEAAWAYVVTWGVAACLSVLMCLLLMRTIPLVHRSRSWLVEHRRTIVDLTASDALSRVMGQSPLWVLAAVGGLHATAGLRAAQIPLGVPRIFLTGLAAPMLSEGTRMYALRPDRLGPSIRVWAASAGLMVLGVGVGLAVAPDWVGPAIAGESWQYASDILWWVVVIAVANAAIVPAQVGLNSIGSTRRAAVTRAWMAPAPALCTFVGGLIGGAVAAVIGTAVGMAVGAVVFQVAFEREYARRPPAPASDESALQASGA